jgi:hypothetical protein
MYNTHLSMRPPWVSPRREDWTSQRLRSRALINPLGVSSSGCERILEHQICRAVWRILCIRHLDNNALRCRNSPTSSIEPGPVNLILGLCGVDVESGISAGPLDKTTGLDRSIFVGIGKDGAGLCIPWATKSTLSFDRRSNGCIGGKDVGIVYVGAVLVHKSRISPLPCDNASAAVAKGECGILDPERAESIQLISLTSDSTIIEVGVADFADINCVLVGVE